MKFESSTNTKMGSFSFRHELQHQISQKKCCELTANEECSTFTIDEVHKDVSVEKIPTKECLETKKMKTVADISLNKEKLEKIIKKKKW
jgi:hypothetical protein